MKTSNLEEMATVVQKYKSDIIALAYGGAAVFLGLALWSYNPRDPSFTTSNWSRPVVNACGVFGSFLSDTLYQLFGIGAVAFPFAMALVAIFTISKVKVRFPQIRAIWIFLLVVTGSSLLAQYFPEIRYFRGEVRAGGVIGMGVHHVLVKAFKPAGAQVLLWVSFLVLCIFSFDRTLLELLRIPKRVVTFLWAGLIGIFEKAWQENRSEAKAKPVATKRPEKKIEPIVLPDFKLEQEIIDDDEDAEPEEIIEDEPPVLEFPKEIKVETQGSGKRKVVEKVKVVRNIENWELPKISLIEDPPASRIRVDEKEIRKKGELLKEKLALFDVRGDVVAARPGPVVTMFEFKPDADIKLSKITELDDDLALALSSESLRILAPIPGRDVVGIETSNLQREIVYQKDMLAEEDFWKEDIKLPIALGKQANGDIHIVDLRKMPHLMVAGTTGSGKSVFTVSTITGLLCRHSPKTLRMILIDPKQVDLAAFEKVPHLMMPVITDTRQAVMSLKWAVREMEKRYKSMSKFAARGLEDYNKNVSGLTKDEIVEHEKINQELEQTPGKKNETYYCQPLPYIVIVVEEFADLMVTDKANVETSVVRLAQKARACGIHLMICMQSPRKEVVTGLIRTNFSSRIAFKVSDGMESRIILDGVGAERMLAQGDMLFKGLGNSNLVRHHGPYLKDSDVQAITKFWAGQGEPAFDPNVMAVLDGSSEAAGADAGGGGGTEEYDPKYDEILAWASTQKEISASLIQRRFQLGYPRAARLIETFEREGVVGPASGSKPRQVLVNNLSNLGA